MFFRFFYKSTIIAYYVVAWIAAIFSVKAKKWIKSRKGIFEDIKVDNLSEKNVIWFHISSLGEFEQIRPFIEKFKQKYSSEKILITFFSPSGYEIRKNYEYADYVHYLPIDTQKNAIKFIEIVKPKIVFWAKYDFWFNYIEQVYKNSIPLFLISGLFRENQIFFKKIGKNYAKLLTYFTHSFVQDENSERLLKTLGISNVTVVGDTRIDRVIEIAEKSVDIELVEKFVDNKTCFVAGSSWLLDEKVISQFINFNHNDVKYIFAPHELEEDRIIQLLQMLNKKVVRFSKAKLENIADFQVLIVDNIGMLSSIYKYAKIAYIGGGFGEGIHNTLEAAVFGMPVIFAKRKYKRFKEAREMVEKKIAFTIENYEDFERIMKTFLSDENFLNRTAEKAKEYIYQNKGATEKILENKIISEKL